MGLWHPTLFLILHLYIWEQIFAFSRSSSNFLPNKLINITAKQACKCWNFVINLLGFAWTYANGKPCTENCTLRVLVKNSCVHVSIMFVSCNLELLALVEFVPIECVILAVSYYQFFREVIQHLVIQGQGTSSLGFTILLVSYFALPVCLWSIKWRCQGQGWTWWGIWWWRRRGRGREDIFSEEAVALSHYMITFPMW